MRTTSAALTGGSVLAALLVAGGLSLTTTHPVLAQAGTQGQWRTLTNQVPINPVHVALLRTGQVLIVAGSGNVAAETNFQAAVWDPVAQTFVTRSLGWDMFCNGMVTLHDGRVFINGGNLKYDPFWGEPRNAVFDPMTGLFTDVENMLHGRWYPTTTTLGDGRVMTFSGLRETGGTNTAVEMYTVGSGWSQEYPAGWTPPLYPRMHLSTDGRVFYAGSSRFSRFFNPSNGTWTGTVATTNHSVSRGYGTSVMLPLTPANGYQPRVMILGGGNPGTATTEIIDLSAATPQWQFGPSMSQPRIQLNATLLPNGKVLATGGSRDDESAATASLNGDLYDPATNTFSSAGANVFPRLYHSNALLLADATVLLIGGNPQRGNYEPRLEIYSPAYLFNGDGSAAVRPTITGVPQSVGYGLPFQVQTPNAADIASVVLVRPGTPTHAFDMDQRLVGLSFTAGGGLLNVTAPPNGNIAPPGYYMLFVLNSAGVPSVARFVKISAPVPDFGISATPASATVNRGDSTAYNVTITPDGGFAGPVTLGVSGLPTGTVGTFSVNPTTTGSVLSIATTAGTPAGAYPLTITGVSGTLTRSTTVALNVAEISVTAPNTAVSWNVGTSQSITFTHNLGTGQAVNIDISRDGGGSWTPITTVTTESATNGSFSWTVSGPATTQGRIRATWASSGLVTDTSDVDFTIVNSVLITIGETNTLPIEDRNNGNILIAQQATLTQAATIQSLSFHVTTTAGDLRLGIYDATGPGGGPGSKKAETNSFVPVLGWNTVDATPHVTLPPGTYWLAYLPSSNDLGFTVVYTGTSRYYSFPFGEMPATFSTSPTAIGVHWSLYATFTTAPPDTNPPSMPTGLSATTVSSSQIDLAWTASTDDVSVTGYKIFRNGSQVNTASTPSFSDTGLAASTTYTYAVSAYDAAGNDSPTSPPAAATTSPPSFDFALANGGNKSVARGSSVDSAITATLVSGATENVVFSTSGLPAGATASYAPASCSPGCTTTITIATTAATPLATSTITVTGTAGSLVRTTTFSLTVTSTADTTAPLVALGASPAGGSTIRGTLTLSATASDNVGVVGVQFLLDGANLGTEDTTSPYSRSWNTTTSSNGPHALSARARDAAGNTTVATVVNVTVDNQAPTGTIVINGGAAQANSRTATLTLAASDNSGSVSQMRFSNSGSGFSTAEAYATTKTWTLTNGAGTKTVYVQFRDAAGNWSSAAITDTIVLDTTAPTVSAVAATGVTSGSATITWTTSEPATSQVEYGPTTSYGNLTALDATLVTAHATPLTGLNPQTTYHYRVRSVDAAGNQRVGTNQTFTTPAAPPDVTPPSVPVNVTSSVR